MKVSQQRSHTKLLGKKLFSHLLLTSVGTVLWAILTDLKDSKVALKKLLGRVNQTKTKKKSVLVYNPFTYKILSLY